MPTATGRRTRCRTSQRTAGSRLTATNSATSTSASTPRTVHNTIKPKPTAVTPQAAAAAQRKTWPAVIRPVLTRSRCPRAT
ncbi:hypothetical protein GCM10010432_34680 [Catellatospora methionotrophica]